MTIYKKIIVERESRKKKYHVLFQDIKKDRWDGTVLDIKSLRIFESKDSANYYAKNKARKLKLPVELWLGNPTIRSN